MRPFCCLAALNWDPIMTFFKNKNIANSALPIGLYASNVDAKIVAEMASKAWDEFPWEKRDAPRRECFYSSVGKSYTYGSGRGERTYHPVPYSEMVGEWTREVEAFLNTSFELCFANGYESAKEHLGWHADDSPEVDDNRPIAVLSLGAEREIWVRPRGGDFSTVEKFVLPSGSLFVMNAGMQDTHDHRIPKCDHNCGYRVSLTWRGAA